MLRNSTVSEQYTVTVKRPEGVSISEMNAYIKEAIVGWSGGFHPEDPRNDIQVTSVRRIKQENENGSGKRPKVT